MNAGLDVGYSHVKLVADGVTARFPSIYGNVERETFTLNEGGDDTIILTIPEDGDWVIGDGALHLSRFRPRHEDRNWIESPAYMRYYLAALTALTRANYADVRLVTGLPVTYFAQDHGKLEERLTGDFRVKREGQHWQKFAVSEVAVVPQPFGTLLDQVLNRQGRIVDNTLATGHVGIVDIGGKTTGYLSVDTLAEVPPETTSIDVGCWEALTLIRDAVNARFPGLDLDDHEASTMVADGATVRYYGEPHDMHDLVVDALDPLAERVIAEATTLWNGGARLDAILVTGGGANLVGPALCRHFKHARIVADSTYANARGYYKFAVRLFAQ